MRSFSSQLIGVVLLFILFCFDSVSCASGDYGGQSKAVIAAAKPLQGTGYYKMVNVATGQTLTFYRGKSVTNFYPMAKGSPVEIQVSGKTLRISGENNKCMSAQWGGSYDHAAVSYACAVGKGQSGTKTLEKPKQFWYAVPATKGYYLIAQDHLKDMVARAVSGTAINTVGGYRSTRLDVWKKGTKSQMWTITKVKST